MKATYFLKVVRTLVQLIDEVLYLFDPYLQLLVPKLSIFRIMHRAPILFISILLFGIIARSIVVIQGYHEVPVACEVTTQTTVGSAAAGEAMTKY